MVNYLSLKSFNGRLFVNPPIPEQDGLLAVIDFKSKAKAYQPVDINFNNTGDSFVIADSKGQVTLFQVAANRFLIVNQSNSKEINCATFTGKHPQDQLFLVFKDKGAETHSLNGKLLEKYQSIHDLEVKGAEQNFKMNQFLTFSGDACHIWTNNGSSGSVQKVRSLFAKDGMMFMQARFHPDGLLVVTLLKDGGIIQWSLDNSAQLDNQIYSLSFKSKQLTCFDLCSTHIVAAGKDFPYLVYKSINNLSNKEGYFNLPNGCRGVDQLQLMSDKNLLAFLSEGQLFVVDISSNDQFQQDKKQIKLNIRLPNEQIKKFQVDVCMNLVTLITSNGNAYLYDLPKAFENERLISKKKIDMGLEKNLVFSYLIRANDEEIKSNYNEQSIFKSTMSAVSQPQTVPSFMNPLITSNQRLIESQEYQVGQTMNSQINPFVQKTLKEVQSHQLSTLDQNMVSIQSDALLHNKSQANRKQEIMNHGLSTTLAKNSTFKKPQASIVSSTMTGFNPIFSNLKSTIQNQQRSVMSIQESQPQQSKYIIDENFQPDYNITKSTLTQSQMAQFNVPKLKQMLKNYGEFPDKYRFLTWKYLLELPLNKETFANLVRRGVHPAYKNLHQLYPIAQHKLYNKLVRTLSAIGYWSPIFLDVEYMPALIFPFIKVIPNDDLLVFEITMSLVMQYMQNWFEAFPSDPINPLMALDQIIQNENYSLLGHLKAHSFSPNIYGWPLIKNLFTEILSKEDWLKLMDHLFTYKEDPELVIYFAAAYLLSNKGGIMNISTAEELHNFQTTPTGIPLKKILTLTFKLHQKYSKEIFTGHISQNLPLIKLDPQTGQQMGEYPLFNRYPEHIVANTQKVRAKIALEEDEIARKQALLEDLKLKQEQILANEENIRRHQEAALQAELERKVKLQNEQDLLLQERIRLDEMTRLAKLEHIKKLEDAVMNAMNRQEELKNQETRVAEEELNQRQRQAQYEYQARLQDEMINNLEFKANQRMLELMQKNQSEEQIRKMKSEFEQRQREDEHKDKVVQERWRLEDQEQRLKNELFRQAMQQQTQTMKQLAEKAKIEEQFRQQEHEKELKLLQIEEQRRLRALEEEQVLRKQQMLEEIRLKGENLNQQEIEQRWMQVNYEREKERERAQSRMMEIERERERLEIAIEREKEEQERLEEIERKKRHEETIALNRTILSNFSEQQTINAENIKRQLQQEREDAEFRRIEMMRREAQLRDQQRQENQELMQLIKSTGENINNIVEKGQRDLEERKFNRNQSQNYQSSIPGYQPIRVRDPNSSLERKIQERERLYKEQNDQLLRQYSEEKENFRHSQNYSVGNNSIQPYQQKPIDLQTHSFNPYAHQNQDPRQRQGGQLDASERGASQMSESESSLGNSHGDSEAVRKHYQIKQQVEDYHRNYNQKPPSQVFDYQPNTQNPPTQLRGHQLSSQIEKSNKKRSQKKKRETQTSMTSDGQQESYYNSSSSSNSSDEDDSESNDNNSQIDDGTSQSDGSAISSNISIKQSANFAGANSANHRPLGSQHSANFNQNFQQSQHHHKQATQSDEYSSLSSSSSNSQYAQSPQQIPGNRMYDATSGGSNQRPFEYNQTYGMGSNPFTQKIDNLQYNQSSNHYGAYPNNQAYGQQNNLSPSSGYQSQSPYQPSAYYQNQVNTRY